MQINNFRTRQAPSPTGFLHLGTARTMLFTQLIARMRDGVWYLRLEDTDRQRLNTEAVGSLLSSMDSLGLVPDEGVNIRGEGVKDSFYDIFQKGDYGPYIQSERLDLYHSYAQKLIDEKKAYWSYLTPEDKQDLLTIKNKTGQTIDYFAENIIRHPQYNNSPQTLSELKIACLEDTDRLFQSVQKALLDDAKPALMFMMKEDRILSCDDILLGGSSFDLNLEEDFVILKSDGYPTYHLAHAVDDYIMKTSLVIRGQEWYASLPKHIKLFDTLWGGNSAPEYLHVPVILGEVGNKKMSKRDGNVNIQDYIDKGYLPEAIINYLAFLGWNPGTEKELYLNKEDFVGTHTKERLHILMSNIVKEFSIETLSKSPARFNTEKLNWFNREYIKMMTHDEWNEQAKNYLHIDYVSDITSVLALNLDKNRITTLSEFGTESSCIMSWKPPLHDEIKWKKISLEESITNLKEITNWLKDDTAIQKYTGSQSIEIYQTNVTKLENVIKQWLIDNNKDVGSYLWPLRVALSGKTKSPSPFEILGILSLENIVYRVETSIGSAQN